MEWWLLAVVMMKVVQSGQAQPEQKVGGVGQAKNETSLRSCGDDDDCEESSGEMCCFDLSSPSQWKDDQSGWKKKCCTNLSGSPVIRPPATPSLTQQQMARLDKGISYLAPYFLDFVVCEGLTYQTMEQLPSCVAFTSTTSTTDRTSKLSQTSSATINCMGMAPIMAISIQLVSCYI